MPSDECSLTSDISALSDVSSASHHEYIRSHGTCQLGMITKGQPLVFSRTLTLMHKDERPYWNLACETSVPSWMSSLTVTPRGLIPPPPGFLPVGFMPGILPVLPAQVIGATTATGLTTPTVAPFTPPLAEQQALLLATLPGGFASWSMPGTVHQLSVQGSVAIGLAPDFYRHSLYITASSSFNSPVREKIAKFTICLLVGDTR